MPKHKENCNHNHTPDSTFNCGCSCACKGISKDGIHTKEKCTFTGIAKSNIPLPKYLGFKASDDTRFCTCDLYFASWGQHKFECDFGRSIPAPKEPQEHCEKCINFVGGTFVGSFPHSDCPCHKDESARVYNHVKSEAQERLIEELKKKVRLLSQQNFIGDREDFGRQSAIKEVLKMLRKI